MNRIALGILGFLLAFTWACSTRPERLVLGVALSENSHPGVELAAKEINASGGINGVLIELMGLEWKDSGRFVAKDILRWARQFAGTKDLLAVIGHSDSSSTLSAAAVYNQHKVPQIVTIATNPAITNIGDWTYRLCLSDAAQGPALAEYAVKDWGKKRIAVFYVNDDYGRGLAQLFEKRVRELGGEIVSSIMHRNMLESEDEALIRSALADMKKKGAHDLIVLFQRLAAADWTVAAIRETGIHSDLLGGDTLGPIGWLKNHPELKEGLRISQFFLPDPQDQRAMQFVHNFRQFAGQEPEYGVVFAYEAVYLMRDAILSGGFTRAGVKSYLDRLIRERIPIEGVGGRYTLGTDHDARRSIYIVEARGGTHHFLKRVDVN